MIILITKKRTFKLKYMEVNKNPDNEDFSLFCASWDGYTTRAITGTKELCELAKNELDEAILRGESAYRLVPRDLYKQLRTQDSKFYAPLSQQEVENLSRPLDKTTVALFYNTVERDISQRPSVKNDWGLYTPAGLMRRYNIPSVEIAYEVLERLCEQMRATKKEVNGVVMYSIPFKRT